MIILCCAWSEESKYLDINKLTEQLDAEITLVHLGVGYLSAQATLYCELVKLKASGKDIQKIIFWGTAGLIAKNIEDEKSFILKEFEIPKIWALYKYPIFSNIVLIGKSSMLRLASLLGSSYTPVNYPSFDLAVSDLNSVMNLNSKTDFFENAVHNDFEQITCFSALEITNNAQASCKILKEEGLDYACENMELYGVAKFAFDQNINLEAMVGLTNYTNAKAHQDWQRNHQPTSENLCKAITEINSNINFY